MAAGDVIVQLRRAIESALPYIRHTFACRWEQRRGACDCGADAKRAELARLTRVDPARTGGRRPPGAALVLALALGLYGCASARPIGGTTVYVRDTVRAAPITLPPDTIRTPAVTLAPDTIKPPTIQLAPDTIKAPRVVLPPDSIRPPAVVLAPDTVKPPRVMLPPDTVKLPNVMLAPDTIVTHVPLVIPVDTMPHTIPAGAGVPDVQADTNGLHIYDWPSRYGENNVYHGTVYLGRIQQDNAGAWIVYRYLVSDSDPVLLRRDCEAYTSRYIALVMLDTPPNAMSWRVDHRGRVLDSAHGCTYAP